jgi:N-acetylglucosaminyldiphosphoundecaprenol N-acetyl-beta-D-mannosaminyltransferase
MMDAMNRFAVLDVGISALTRAAAVRRILEWVAQRDKTYVNVCTVDTVLKCHDDPALAAIVNGSGMATADGMPLVWVGKARGFRAERVYGPDLMLGVMEAGYARQLRHFFYGATDATLLTLRERFEVRFPGLVVVGCHAPPFRPLDEDEVVSVAALINATRPDVVWVGIGTPRQDYWMARFRPLLEAPVLVAVGAAFDFHSGRVRQAPRWMMGVGLEWLFRLIMEPRRLWRRYLVGNARFIGLMCYYGKLRGWRS